MSDDRVGVYSGGKPASEMKPPAKVPSGSLTAPRVDHWSQTFDANGYERLVPMQAHRDVLAATLREILGVGEHVQGWIHPATPTHHINRWIAALNEHDGHLDVGDYRDPIHDALEREET